MAMESRAILGAQRLEAYQRLVAPHPPKVACPDKLALHEHAAGVIGTEAIVDYLEFGVASGATTARFCQRFKNKSARFVGFDSFEGLPEDWFHLKRGLFSRDGKIPLIGDPRVSFVKGYFQNTVFSYFAQWQYRDTATVLVNYDADLYGSTLHVLSALWLYIPEYYFLMDEFWFEDLIALHDFSRAFPVEIEWIAAVNGRDEKPAKVFGRMRRVEFTLPPEVSAAAATAGI